jgi:hypothetical protein
MAELAPDPGSIQLPEGSGLKPDQGSIRLPPLPGQQAPDRGALEAAAKGALNGGSFGASAAISAAIDNTAQKILPNRFLDFIQRHTEGPHLPINEEHTYDERRAAYQGGYQTAQQQHPYAFGAGELAGSLAVPVPGAGGAGAAAERFVAKRTGSLLARKTAGAVASGAVTGELFGLGSGLSQGKSGLDLVENAELSSLGGAALGGSLHLTGAAVGKIASAAVDKARSALSEKYLQTFGSEVLGNASKKATQKGWAQILGKEAEEGVEQDAAKKFVQSPALAPVEAAARHGKYDQAISEIDSQLEKLRPGRSANYKAVDETGEFQVGKGLDEIDKALFKARNASKNPQATQALEKARNEWVSDYSSADAGALQRTLLRPEGVESTQVADELTKVVNALPQNGRISRSQIAQAVNEAGAGPDSIRYIQEKVLDPKQGLLSWDPKASIPAVELRAQATVRQQSALQAFDKLNPQQSVETKTVVQKAIVKALENHLDEAAKAGKKGVVDRIRQDDVKFSVLLAAKRGLQEQLEKQQRDSFKLATIARHIAGAGTLPAAGLAYGQGKKAGAALEEGDIPGAVEHGAGALFFGGLAGAGIARGASIGTNRLGNALDQLRNTPQGQQLLEAIAARGRQAAIGTVTTGTLGGENASP